jgi:hypothetical protein
MVYSSQGNVAQDKYSTPPKIGYVTLVTLDGICLPHLNQFSRGVACHQQETSLQRRHIRCVAV